MSFRCMIRHDAGSPVLRNGHVLFSSCSRCGIGLIRSGKEWRRIPGGFRLVISVMAAREPIWTEPNRAGSQPAPGGTDMTNRLTRPEGQLALKLPGPGGDMLAVALRMLAWRLSYAAMSWWKKIAAARSKPGGVITLPSRALSLGDL